LVGFDNQELIADGLFPGLTTVALPHYEMGAWAVNTMIKMIDEPDPSRQQRRSRPQHITMECPVVRRQSVAAPGTA
jgi:LacI family transcriptional regulator